VQLANHSALALLDCAHLEGLVIDEHCPALIERLTFGARTRRCVPTA
jgi:two-component system sensor histidine kinase PilS (NtrC family)